MDMKHNIFIPTARPVYKLDRWAIFHSDTIIGYIYDHPTFPRGQRVQTEVIRYVDVPNNEAHCTNEIYKLLEPGSLEEHNVPILGSIA